MSKAEPDRKRQTTLFKNPNANNQVSSLELIMIEKELNEIVDRFDDLIQKRDEILSKTKGKCSYIC